MYMEMGLERENGQKCRMLYFVKICNIRKHIYMDAVVTAVNPCKLVCV